MKFRGVHWAIFPLVLLSTIVVNWNEITFSLILWNTGYLVFLIAMLTLYLLFKNGKITTITKGYFSWGDILILVAFIPMFFFEAFLFFVTVGTFVSLLIHLIVVLFDKKKTVPFAGYMALFAIPIVLNLERYNAFIVSLWS